MASKAIGCGEAGPRDPASCYLTSVRALTRYVTSAIVDPTPGRPNRHSPKPVNIETRLPLTPQKARELLAAASGIRVVDDVGRFLYPMPIDAAGRDETLVGRIRQDSSVENGLVMWVVADNIRKGAATNAVQIAECLVDRGQL